MRGQTEKNIERRHPLLPLAEIGIVVLSGFVTSYVMRAAAFNFFALPHLVFLLTAVFLRSIVGKWKPSDWGFHCQDIRGQIKLGLLMWTVIQAYYAAMHLFAPLFPTASKIGAKIFNVTTPGKLGETILSTALFKAGFLESLRYFAYAEGLLLQAFGAPLGAVMSLAYFGSAHMGIMNLIVLPVSFFFVYFYRTYKLIIPLIIFHILGDTGGMIQNYLSFREMYLYNDILFFLLLIVIFLHRAEIKSALKQIGGALAHDTAYLKKHKLKAVLLSLVLPLWLHFLLYIGSRL